MAIYYIRKTGSDANAGTSAGAAWLTIGKALGASGMASGDTVWIGAGVYREVVTVAMTSATAETKIYADVDGVQTGDAGEVQWTAYTTNYVSTPSGTLLTLNGRDFLTFQDITFQGGAAGVNVIDGVTANSTDITFRRCLIFQGGQLNSNTIAVTSAADVACNWVIDSCVVTKGANCITIVLTRPSAADFNYNIVIKNCLFPMSSTSACISITATGANTFNGGGVTIYSCSCFSAGNFVATGANISTTIPVKVYNCFVYSTSTALNANASGQIVEDYNLLLSSSSPRTNVTAGAHSVSSGSHAPMFYTGHEFYSVGQNLSPFGMPKVGSPLLGFGNQSGSPTVDITGAARPSGTIAVWDTGTATAGAAKTLTNSGKTWGTNSFNGYTIKIISGTGSGQTKNIASNTATVITVDGNWKTNPDSTSVYEVYSGALSSSGTATSGAATTMTDSNAAWGTNMWTGFTLKIDGGTGSGQTKDIVTNTATAITVSTWTTNPDNTSTYKIYRGTDENTVNPSVGCYELTNTAIKETGTVRTGSNAIRIAGPGPQDFVIPVDAISTTITIYTQFDSAYSGTKPSMNIINGTECGVANATATAVGSAGSWEQLSLNFTPTSAGIITVRLLSSTTTPTGNAFFDDFNVI